MMKHLRENQWVWILIVLKIVLHLIAINKYGFHRDEFLYLVQGNHLMWGYLEVPPFIAVLGKIATGLFGSSIVGIRLFPLLAGVLILWLIGQMVKELGGSTLAILFAGLAFVFSPMFLRVNHLFQPVSFNQLWWVVISYLLIKIINANQSRSWYFLGIAAGLGFLTKYSILFFVFALLFGILLSRHRKWFMRKEFYLAIIIAFIIALPNLIWQYTHDFPIVNHMNELATSQLVNVRPSDFLVEQILFHFSGSIVWVAGLLFLLFSPSMKSYRFFGFGYLFLIAVLLFLSGKSYYSVGIYPVLMAAGGVYFGKLFRERNPIFAVGFALFLFIANLGIIPYGLPVLSQEKMIAYGKKMIDRYGLDAPLRWEDGQVYALPQDYADMHGWEEMVKNVSDFYHGLPDSVRNECILYGGGYSHTATMNFYREKYKLPETYSFNNSFVFWVPDTLDFAFQIEIDDRKQTTSRYFGSVELVDSVKNIYAREPGYVHFKSNPTVNIAETWARLAKETKGEFTR